MKPVNFITTPVLIIAHKPAKALRPHQGILSRYFGTKQKNEAPDKWLPHCFPLLWRSVPQELAYCIASHTAVWTEAIHPAQVIQHKGQKPNEYVKHYHHYDAGQLIWTTSYRWWLQGSDVYLAVSFQGQPATVQTVLNDLAVFVPEIAERLAPISCAFLPRFLDSCSSTTVNPPRL